MDDLLRRAAEAFLAIDQAGLSLDLEDSLGFLRKQWHGSHGEQSNRRWRLQLPIGCIAQMTRRLAEATLAPEDDCRAAIVNAIGDDWTTIACREIIRFANAELKPRKGAA